MKHRYLPGYAVAAQVMRLLLVGLLLVAPMQSARSQEGVVKYQSFPDLLDAVRTLRKKTIIEAYFRLEVSKYPSPPFFAPDGKGGAFFVLPVARRFSKAPPAKELEDELTRLRRSSFFTPSYDSQQQRLAYYPPEAVLKLRTQLAPWLLSSAELAKMPFLQLADEVVAARIPPDREAEFLDALLAGLFHSDRTGLKCVIGWN